MLGSGWGAMSVLKKLDTQEYNVVCISCIFHVRLIVHEALLTCWIRLLSAHGTTSFSRLYCPACPSAQSIPVPSFSLPGISRAIRLVVSSCTKERHLPLMSVIPFGTTLWHIDFYLLLIARHQIGYVPRYLSNPRRRRSYHYRL